MSVSRSASTTSQRPAVMSSMSLVSTGFIRVVRSTSGRCPHQQPCSVTLRAAPGQRINVTLLDFTARDDQRVVARHKTHGVETCYRYVCMCACVCVCVGVCVWRKTDSVFTISSLRFSTLAELPTLRAAFSLLQCIAFTICTRNIIARIIYLLPLLLLNSYTYIRTDIFSVFNSLPSIISTRFDETRRCRR